MALRRSATSRSRAEKTRSSATIAFSRAASASGLRLGLGLGLLGHGDGPQLLGQLDQLAALDLQLLDIAFLANPLLLQAALGRDARALDLLARRLLAQVDRAPAVDLQRLHGALAVDPLLLDGAFGVDAHLLDLLPRLQLRLFGVALAAGALARQFGALRGAADLDLALLLEAGIFAVAVDLQAHLLGFQVLVANLDHRCPVRCRCGSSCAARSGR